MFESNILKEGFTLCKFLFYNFHILSFCLAHKATHPLCQTMTLCKRKFKKVYKTKKGQKSPVSQPLTFNLFFL